MEAMAVRPRYRWMTAVATVRTKIPTPRLRPTEEVREEAILFLLSRLTNLWTMPPTDTVDGPIGGLQQRAPLSGISIIWSNHTVLVLKSN
jgi:hypothetical protein